MTEQPKPQDWKVYERTDGQFIVTRLNGCTETLAATGRRSSRFQSREAAERAAAVANVREWLAQALRVAPEPEARPGHIDWYAKTLVRDAGWTLNRARKQCEEWAAEEAFWAECRASFKAAA